MRVASCPDCRRRGGLVRILSGCPVPQLPFRRARNLMTDQRRSFRRDAGRGSVSVRNTCKGRDERTSKTPSGRNVRTSANPRTRMVRTRKKSFAARDLMRSAPPHTCHAHGGTEAGGWGKPLRSYRFSATKRPEMSRQKFNGFIRFHNGFVRFHHVEMNKFRCRSDSWRFPHFRQIFSRFRRCEGLLPVFCPRFDELPAQFDVVQDPVIPRDLPAHP